MHTPHQQRLGLGLGLGLALAAAAASGCKQGQTADKTEEDPPVPVAVTKLEPSSISRVLTYDADVKGALEVKVFSQVPERILALRVKEGDQVRRGQLLAVVRSDTLSAGVSSAAAALDAARAERDQLQAEVRRQTKLLGKNIVSEAQVDQLRARLAAAEAQIRRLEAMVQQASTARSNALIRAPISGVVGQVFLEQGDLALPSVPVLTVVQMDEVELVVDVPELELRQIREGMTARITVSRFPDAVFSGPVARILPTIDRVTRTAKIEINLDNPEHRLMPGMLARVRLEVERHDGVVVAPYGSLVIEMDPRGDVAHRAFVVEEGEARQRVLTLGIVSGDWVEVTKGLAPGELLVVQGQHLLEDGRAVKVVERRAGHEEPGAPLEAKRKAGQEAESKVQ